MGWKWAQVDIYHPQVSEEYYRKSLKLERVTENWWGIIMGVSSGSVIKKIAVRVCAIYYQLLNGTLVMHWQTDQQTDTQYLRPTKFSLKYKTFHSHFVTIALRRSHPPSWCLPYRSETWLGMFGKVCFQMVCYCRILNGFLMYFKLTFQITFFYA